jgi:hypothetical protein
MHLCISTLVRGAMAAKFPQNPDWQQVLHDCYKL